MHVDGKCNDTPFREEVKLCQNVTFIEDRINVYWGGYSAVQATIALMQAALAYDNFDRFVLLQGLEYPIKSNADIEKFFIENQDREFICAQNISIRNDARSIHKYRLYHFLDKPDTFIGKLSRRINHNFLRRNLIPKFKSRTIKDVSGLRLELYQGCAQMALTRAAVEYIVQFYEKNRKVNRYFKTVFTVDEIYFHTIIFNSKFRDKTTGIIDLEYPRLRDFKNLTYFEYPEDTVAICVFKEKEIYDRIKNSGYLYLRKVNSESKELLDYIDNNHLEGII